VTHGYRDCLRRNYLIQILNDDLGALSVGVSEVAKTKFKQARRDDWCAKGIVPRAIFNQLVHKWFAQSNLTSGVEPETDLCKPSSGYCPAYAVDVGLTFEGFQALESHTQLTDLFRKKAPAYAQGAPLRAGSRLGDTGPSAPCTWEERYKKDAIHAVLVVHAHAPSGQAEQAATGFQAFESDVLTHLESPVSTPHTLMRADWIEESTVLGSRPGSRKEVHFGYIDGLSAPRFKKIDTQDRLCKEADFNIHEPGELLLGYRRNDKSNPWAVPGAYAQGVPTPPNPQPARQVYGDFFRDGSFGVLRKMKQKVPEFEAYVEEQAKADLSNANLLYKIAWLKAKMLGRWPNGERVGKAVDVTDIRRIDPKACTTKDAALKAEALLNRMEPQNNNSESAGNNNFDHHKEDPHGYGCPFGAHIRRMNPRDDPVVPILRRPLLRRGAPYGPKYSKGENAGIDRGLLGLFFCASIEEQFEHILGNWSNNNPMGLPFTQAGKDPLVGNQDGIGNSFEIPMSGGQPLLLKGLPAFVETRGTCYAFFPSVQALLKIATGRVVSSTAFLEGM
jgi:deferrochelatase/peroxidase EfeB